MSRKVTQQQQKKLYKGNTQKLTLSNWKQVIMIKERNDKIAKQINENLNSNTDNEVISKLT